MNNHLNQNEPTSSLTHLIGFLLSITALILLLVLSPQNNAWHMVSFSIFGSALTLLYLASTLYHFVPKNSKYKVKFRKIDMSMIFLLIAATYTPITLVPLRGAWGWSVFGIIWGFAILGIVMHATKSDIKTWKSVSLYLLSGWLIVAIIPILIKSMPFAGLVWLFTGGLFYTIGVIFLSLDGVLKRSRWFGMHEIFHLFVLAGSFCHFWLMLTIVANIK